ncbi:L,D-transpeptidase [Hyphomicrobium sp. CS1GBMeth3]|uniref:L,D-transpeptidase n=1 Tax=Hyphomicrobium sp. CS1GBMeth3 TaxID=1892845 RepID=UPI0009315DBC|nr:L,D-transpeptidase [Hyphomicrobium sp. CS1GBMeth3]
MPHCWGNSHPSSTLRKAVSAGSIWAIGLGVLTGASLAAPRAEAQGLFGSWNEPSYTYKPRQKARRLPSAVTAREAKKSSKFKEAETVARPAEGPLVVTISLARQRLTAYDANGSIASSPISSGRVGYATPTGVFTVVQKRRMHFSNLYDSAPMPNMQRLTWSGVAMHAGALPGYPASHGCIRLPHGFSKKLFGMTKMGTRVIVTRDPVSPKPIAHAKLFTAFPPEEETAAAVEETQVADASGVLGVTPAAAEEHDPASLRPHLTYRERRRLETEKLNAEIRTAGYAKAGKQALLEQAHKAAMTTREPLIAARADAERLEEELRKLETELARAERELADLKAPPEETAKSKGKTRRKTKRMNESKRVARMLTLEERIARLPGEIEAVRASYGHATEALRGVESVAKEAEDKRRAALKAYTEANAALQRALAKEEAAKKLEAMRDRPVSIFISRAKQRLYIRQGYDDVLNVAVTFDRPEEPVGTHVFTALDVAESKTDMTWSVVSVPHDPTRSARRTKGTQAKEAPPPPVDLAAQTAAAALDRITVPEDVREQIADVMKPGSSIVISDLGIGNETGAYTDFIVPIR